MPSVLDNLNTAYANVAVLLAEVTASNQPTYTENGRTVQRAEYLQILEQRLLGLKQAIQREESPWMVMTRMRPGGV